MTYYMKVLRPPLLVCGYENHVEHLSCETDFKLAFCEVIQEVAKNLTFPEPLNTNGTGMTFKQMKYVSAVSKNFPFTQHMLS